jgi:hypothetical protein
MLLMEPHDSVPRTLSQPWIKRNGSSPYVVREPARRFDQPLLHNVGCVDTLSDSFVDAQTDRQLEPHSMPDQELIDGSGIAEAARR